MFVGQALSLGHCKMLHFSDEDYNNGTKGQYYKDLYSRNFMNVY